ncbi:DegT/DnrJ/EryC1/StrS family aminotransferase [Roseococcus sp. MDT2-1-1]|uniref:DegT/DnrJ/EryC1/StrS family aminotransferase n=1 Tax=Sabulicella glaciei TaxID=2984948 RepID=A0ABT3NRE0_9PROT|nr:DegT/DnrJ/EryC1/StrS family aminotransferase [Roseococcus sp. MDT2-1-1]MCW8084707.1 DegT/DnrJ/EryC1/StrS family aminotransferase [Roseococcus sp. MDT2-1-1]
MVSASSILEPGIRPTLLPRPALSCSRVAPSLLTVEGALPPIPVARPLLPHVDALLPYLRRIDAARVYANWGPLNAELEVRLAVHCSGHVVSVSSATDGLVCALRAVLEDRPLEARRGLCLMPSWSFVASAHAAIVAGLQPAFLDVGEERWALEPGQVRDAIRAARASQEEISVAAVLVVAPFGLPVDPGPWDAFTQQTGIPVVVDAAAAFDGLSAGCSPAVVSLHATKAVGAGEGGSSPPPIPISLVASSARRISASSGPGLQRFQG